MILVSFYSETMVVDKIKNEKNIALSNLHKIAHAKFEIFCYPSYDILI